MHHRWLIWLWWLWLVHLKGKTIQQFWGKKQQANRNCIEKPKENENQALRFHGNNCFWYCFVTVVLKLDIISYKYNYFPNLSFCQIFSNKCGVNSSWIRRRAGDPCGLSLEWSEAMWWLSTSEERLDNSTNIFC